MSLDNDVVIRKLDQSEAYEIHRFNVELGSENKDFCRWYEDEDFLQERNGLTYHYVEYKTKDFRIEYIESPKQKYTFTGNVVEVAKDVKMEFDDGPLGKD